MAENNFDTLLTQVRHLTERRQNTTTTYLTVNAAIIGIMAFLFKDGHIISFSAQLTFIALLIAGVVACSLWRKLITQFSTVIDWWYKQLRVLEESDPQSNKIITREYEELYLKTKNRPLIGLTRYETALTWLFTAIYSIFFLITLTSLIFHLN